MRYTQGFYSSPSCDGDLILGKISAVDEFLFFPVLRRGSIKRPYVAKLKYVSILPRLATGISDFWGGGIDLDSFYSSPSCDGDQQTVRTPT